MCSVKGQGIVFTSVINSSKELSLTEFVRERRMCFGCLRSGHRSKDCENRMICQTCEKKHLTCLHDNRTEEGRMSTMPNAARDMSNGRKIESSQHRATRTSLEATSNRVLQHVKDTHTSTIIPVWVSARVSRIVKFLCMNFWIHSDTTFLLDDTAKALHA